MRINHTIFDVLKRMRQSSHGQGKGLEWLLWHILLSTS